MREGGRAGGTEGGRPGAGVGLGRWRGEGGDGDCEERCGGMRENFYIKESGTGFFAISPKKYLHSFPFMSAVSAVWRACFQDHSPPPWGDLGRKKNTTHNDYIFWFGEREGNSGTSPPRRVFYFKFSEFYIFLELFFFSIGESFTLFVPPKHEALSQLEKRFVEIGRAHV